MNNPKIAQKGEKGIFKDIKNWRNCQKGKKCAKNVQNKHFTPSFFYSQFNKLLAACIWDNLKGIKGLNKNVFAFKQYKNCLCFEFLTKLSSSAFFPGKNWNSWFFSKLVKMDVFRGKKCSKVGFFLFKVFPFKYAYDHIFKDNVGILKC